jgi:hypothetical protein
MSKRSYQKQLPLFVAVEPGFEGPHLGQYSKVKQKILWVCFQYISLIALSMLNVAFGSAADIKKHPRLGET